MKFLSLNRLNWKNPVENNECIPLALSTSKWWKRNKKMKKRKCGESTFNLIMLSLKIHANPIEIDMARILYDNLLHIENLVLFVLLSFSLLLLMLLLLLLPAAHRFHAQYLYTHEVVCGRIWNAFNALYKQKITII